MLGDLKIADEVADVAGRENIQQAFRHEGELRGGDLLDLLAGDDEFFSRSLNADGRSSLVGQDPVQNAAAFECDCGHAIGFGEGGGGIDNVFEEVGEIRPLSSREVRSDLRSLAEEGVAVRAVFGEKPPTVFQIGALQYGPGELLMEGIDFGTFAGGDIAQFGPKLPDFDANTFIFVPGHLANLESGDRFPGDFVFGN